ncbi:hypothetical protein CJU90_1511 [Yarrowia sp. C11]|nr:hypothetical protein CKK34_0235 [Yarrowia sp. E02]KAG5371478.1 hypothetical protein CJU90_1511 [Yarrowia sp. C11]
MSDFEAIRLAFESGTPWTSAYPDPKLHSLVALVSIIIGFFLTGAFIISDKRIKTAGASIVFPVGTAALATFAFAVGGLFLASAAGLAP